MANLANEDLTNVAGGSRREHTVIVTVDYSNDTKFTGDVSIKAYLNGEFLSDQEKSIDCSVTVFTINVKGQGIGSLKVKINNLLIKEYDVNFDEGTYTQIL